MGGGFFDLVTVIFIIFGIVSFINKKSKQQHTTTKTGQGSEPEKPWQRMLGDVSKTIEQELTGKQPQKVFKPAPAGTALPSAFFPKASVQETPAPVTAEATMIPANYVDTEGTSAPQQPLPAWHGSLTGTEGSVAATAAITPAQTAVFDARIVQPAIQFTFTKDTMLQAVVMSEILTRPADRRRRWVHH
jgi:hypothetical protein